jgi:2-phosphosulfolactate phosphatase
MNVDVLLLPKDFTAAHAETAVVVFDVLRATTTIAAALAAGAREVRVFGSLDDARVAAASAPQPRLLCGEHRCLPPAGFDLGNSPGAFTADAVAGRTIYLSTTNGTRALVAARAARHLFTGALVNAAAVAAQLHALGRDVTLLSAGTDGAVAAEDLLGCGAVIDELRRLTSVNVASDSALVADELFVARRGDLLGTLLQTRGGRNVVAAGLRDDVRFCAALNTVPIVGRCDGETLTIRRTQ